MNIRQVESQCAITNPVGFDIYVEQRTFAIHRGAIGRRKRDKQHAVLVYGLR